MNLQDYKKQALLDEDFRKEYESFDIVFEIRQMIIRAKLVLRNLFNN